MSIFCLKLSTTFVALSWEAKFIFTFLSSPRVYSIYWCSLTASYTPPNQNPYFHLWLPYGQRNVHLLSNHFLTMANANHPRRGSTLLYVQVLSNIPRLF